MIPSLFLLSAGVFATPVFISDVKAVREAGHLRVEVSGDGGIDPEGARTKIDDGLLLIYLGGTRVKADNRAWDLEEGSGQIRAHRHKSETELVVPLAGNGCNGPVELTGSTTGITALVGCEGTVTYGKGTTNAKATNNARETTSEIASKLPAKSGLSEDKLKKLVELPSAAARATAPRAEASDVEGMAPSKARAPTAGPMLVAIAPASPLATSAPVLAPPRALPVAPLVVAASTGAPTVARAVVAGTGSPGVAATVLPGAGPIPAGGSPAGGLRAIAVPALLLSALAVAAYLFARRRRTFVERRIEILETASLGPKRSLIVARIGGETLILGSSEAGITLLKGTPGPVNDAPVTGSDGAAAIAAAVARQAADSAREIAQPIEEALADIPEPDSAVPMLGRGGFRSIEGGMASLFGRRGAAADPEVVFDDLLEDSVEDQELRRKLAAGMSARVR
jgi:flagellar protein FliO/FliZ